MRHLQSSSSETALDIESFVRFGAVEDALSDCAVSVIVLTETCKRTRAILNLAR